MTIPESQPLFFFSENIYGRAETLMSNSADACRSNSPGISSKRCIRTMEQKTERCLPFLFLPKNRQKKKTEKRNSIGSKSFLVTPLTFPFFFSHTKPCLLAHNCWPTTLTTQKHIHEACDNLHTTRFS